MTSSNGQRMTETAWKRLWESYMNDLNLTYGKAINKRNKFDPKGNIMTIEPFTPHCLRHTFCTIMYESGIDVLTAKEQMGHSDVKTTLSIYTHLDKNTRKRMLTKWTIILQAENEQFPAFFDEILTSTLTSTNAQNSEKSHQFVQLSSEYLRHSKSP